jgi:hypothetical protein
MYCVRCSVKYTKYTALQSLLKTLGIQLKILKIPENIPKIPKKSLKILEFSEIFLKLLIYFPNS